MTEETTKAVVAAAKDLGTACAEVERIGRYLQTGINPSPAFVAPRLDRAKAAREKLAEAVSEVVGEDPTPPRIRPRAR